MPKTNKIAIRKLKQFENWQFIHNCFKIIFPVQKIRLINWQKNVRT